VGELTGAFSCILKEPGKKQVVKAGELTLVRTNKEGFEQT